MTSISEIHRATVLEHVATTLYATGVRPTTSTILQQLTRYFRDNPPGRPLSTPRGTNAAQLRSDPQAMNQAMANIITNLSMLYRANASQGQEIMELNTLLKTYLDKLVVKRKKLFTQIDDYLLSLYNTDGYYYSISDSFADLAKVSLDMTNAFVDVATNKVTLPITKSLSADLTVNGFPRTTLNVYTTGAVSDITSLEASTDLKPVTYTTTGDMGNAFDGLTNTAWSIEIELEKKQELLAELTIRPDNSGRSIEVSRIEVDTFGVVPVQVYAETIGTDPEDVQVFGDSVVTTDTRAAFIDNVALAREVRLRFRKSDPDYTYTRSNKTYYKYIFGAKDIFITKSIYDNQAVFVSQPLSILEPFTSFIDAVSLHVEDSIPEGTFIDYFVAKDDPNAETAAELEWKQIVPVQNVGDDNKVVRFNSTTQLSNFIRVQPTDSEYQLILPNTTDPDRKLRNPSPSILSNGSVWRIAEIGDDFVPETMHLEEGFNTVRVLYKNYLQTNHDSLDNWTAAIKGEQTVSEAYIRIDDGRGFFSGIDIGQAYKSFYVETYIESDREWETLVRECVKTSDQSRVWDLKLFLNGEEIADLPAGTVTLPVTWKINKGLNHVALLVDVPAGTASVQHPEWGIFELMRDDSLYNYGVVRLNKWSYVDEFTLNEDTTTLAKPNESVKFSVVNGEIISRIKPTDNFRIRFAKNNEQAPDAIRLKAELSRSTQDPNVTPSIDLYRLRFQHGE